MKTYYFSLQNKILFSFLGLVGLTLTSCGSYQNKSYYDNDGIYGAEKQASNNEESKVENTSNNKYKEYFAANANNYSDNQTETFTDVENYSSQNDTVTTQKTEDRAGWGDNSDNVTINVYNNDWGWNNSVYWHSYWGYRPWRTGIYLGWNTWNYGWCDPWGYAGYYGPYWGYYSPYHYGYYGNYYGYGYNNYYGGYYGRNYVYGNGRRGVANGDRYAYNSTNRTRDYNNPSRSSISPRRSNLDNPRTSLSPRSTPRPRSNSESNNTNTARPRLRSESPRVLENNTPRSIPRPSAPRSESPRSYESPRSEPRTSSPRTYESPRSYDSPRSSSGSSNSGSSNGGGRGGRR